MPIRNEAWPEGTPAWIDCQVEDPDKAAQFYEGLFGWEIQDGGPDSGGYLMALKAGAPGAAGDRGFPRRTLGCHRRSAGRGDRHHRSSKTVGAMPAPKT